MHHADWHTLGEVPYRKFPIYETLGWGDSFDLDANIICGSNFGGPLAVIKDDKKIGSRNAPMSNTKLTLFTSSGRKLADIDWDNKRIAGMGWSDREELVVVLEDGKSRTGVTLYLSVEPEFGRICNFWIGFSNNSPIMRILFPCILRQCVHI
jgi:vacuolar protein sorting-associated protein 16